MNPTSSAAAALPATLMEPLSAAFRTAVLGWRCVLTWKASPVHNDSVSTIALALPEAGVVEMSTLTAAGMASGLIPGAVTQ